MKDNHDESIRKQLDRLGRPAVAALDREIARMERREAYVRLARGALAGLITAAAAVVIATNLWVAVLQIDGTSMNPLLQMDEIVLAVRNGKPARNDIIAFTHSNHIYIKRVVAAGGDRVDIRRDGTVAVNGTILDEPYVTGLSLGSCDVEFPFHVPPGTVFVLGDNRPSALDSRDSGFGTVGGEQVVGKVICRIWPLSRAGIVQ